MLRRKIVQSEKGQELSNKNALESIKTQITERREQNNEYKSWGNILFKAGTQ
jgi:hypothetical protein